MLYRAIDEVHAYREAAARGAQPMQLWEIDMVEHPENWQ